MTGRWGTGAALAAAALALALAAGGAGPNVACAAGVPGGASGSWPTGPIGQTGAGTVVVPVATTHVGSIGLGAGTVVVRGVEIGTVTVGVGAVEVSGRVTGSIEVGMGEVILAHGARVGGRVSVGMGREVRLAPGQPLPLTVGGVDRTETLTFAPAPPLPAVGVWPLAAVVRAAAGALPLGGGPALAVAPLVGRVAWWLVSLAVALVVLVLFPEPVRRLVDDVEAAPLSALGWGTLVALAAGPAAVLLAITLLGIPLALLLVLAVLLAKVLGYVAVSLLLGRRLLPRLGVRDGAIGWELVAGTVLLLLVGSVPVLGALVDLAVALVGIGASGRTGFGTGRPWLRAPRPGPVA
jgi:hypothetical protein